MMPDKAKEEIEAALSVLSADPSLGYLAVTAKPELPVRDRVACHFHQKHPNLIAAREYMDAGIKLTSFILEPR
jgi:hypothetical protein